MKLNKSFLMVLIVVVIIFIVIFYLLNRNKDTNVVSEDNNNVVSENKLDQLEQSLEEAGIQTVETFADDTGYTKKELRRMITLYYPKMKCVLEKAFTDGLINDNNEKVLLLENSEGKVVVLRGNDVVSEEVDDGRILNAEGVIQILGIFSLIFALENDNLKDYYDAFIGIISVVANSNKNMFATYDKDNKDPYSTLVLYQNKTDIANKNIEDYLEAISFVEEPTNNVGKRAKYVKYTARIQFDRNKKIIDSLKQNNFSQKIYDEMISCNSK